MIKTTLRIINIKIFIIFLLAFPSNSNAQDIDQIITSNINESFISSLPPELRGDLLNGQNLEDPLVDAPDPKTRITNLEASLNQAERTINQIKSEINSKYPNQ